MDSLTDLQTEGDQHYRAGRFDEARRCYEQYLQAASASPYVWYMLAAVEHARADFGAAEHAVREALKVEPDYAPGLYQLGLTLAHTGRHADAVESFRRLLARKPMFGLAYLQLGNSLVALGRLDEAEEVYRAGLRFNPNDPQAFVELATTLSQQMKPQAAWAVLEQAAQVAPQSPEVQYARAVALVDLGRPAEAIPLAHESLRLKPDFALPFSLLAELMRDGAYRYSEPEIAAVRALLAKAQTPLVDRMSLHFTMGYVLETEARYDEAFEHFRQGNEARFQDLRSRGMAFDPGAYPAVIDDFIGTFPAEVFPPLAPLGHPSEKPTFIVGIPRSGTTLVNQILAAHPNVCGPGEMGDVGRFLGELPRLLNRPGGRGIMRHLDRATAHTLAERYLRRLDQFGDSALRVIDKTPENYLFLGLIAVLFPNARIIHCRRDPLDTCVSCYTQNFQYLRFTTTLEGLGVYYRQYERLMAHWHAVLPIKILDVQYEELVAQPEAVSRALVAHCGLDWDDRCLSFHRQGGVVHTASRTQVRAPVHTRSVARWRRYEKHLGPLFEALGDAVR